MGLDGRLNTYGYVGGNPLRFIDSKGLLPDSLSNACSRRPDICADIGLTGATPLVPAATEIRILSQSSEIIAKGKNIRKVEELCNKFGGKAKDWVKKKGWDSNKKEWHWYENKGKKIGWKKAGDNDPF